MTNTLCVIPNISAGKDGFILIKQWTVFIINKWNEPIIQWVVQTCYYLAILFALLWIYGVHNNPTGGFIYQDF
ncbi:MAG TPA: hypothetical protein DDW50_11775 [Firmicutes bacterium]|nr:hypothetical protein [Bacillota bacterium]